MRIRPIFHINHPVVPDDEAALFNDNELKELERFSNVKLSETSVETFAADFGLKNWLKLFRLSPPPPFKDLGADNTLLILPPNLKELGEPFFNFFSKIRKNVPAYWL